MSNAVIIGRPAAPKGAATASRLIDRHVQANFYPTPPEATRALLSVEEFDAARVCDKLIIALPREMTPEQRHGVVRDFMQEMGKGRIAWAAAHHDRGEDAANPHAHVVFRDRDIETNRRVVGTTTSRSEVKEATENGWKPPPMMSTKDMRAAWCASLNRYCEQEGLALRFDARSLKEQGINREAQIHVGPRAHAIAAAGKEIAGSTQQERGERTLPYPALDEGSRLEHNTAIIARNARRAIVAGQQAAAPELTGQKQQQPAKAAEAHAETPERREAKEKRILREEHTKQRAGMYKDQALDLSALRQLARAEIDAHKVWAKDSYSKARQEAHDGVGAEFAAKWAAVKGTADPRERAAHASALKDAQAQAYKAAITEKLSAAREEKNRRHMDMKAAQQTKRDQLRAIHKEERREAVNQHGAERNALHGASPKPADIEPFALLPSDGAR